MLDCTLPPSVNHRSTISLPPSVKHGWLLPCHQQSDTTDFPCHHQSVTTDFPCHHQSDTADSLPPMSRTPCPVVSNVLDIQHLHLRALYSVHFSSMNIAVCKQMSSWLIVDIVYKWKLTHSWTLYHLYDLVSIFIKQMSLCHRVWHICWCGRKYHNALLVSSKTELAYFLCRILLFVLSWNKYFTPRLNSISEIMQMMESSSSLEYL